jgi:hypothetical protein
VVSAFAARAKRTRDLSARLPRPEAAQLRHAGDELHSALNGETPRADALRQGERPALMAALLEEEGIMRKEIAPKRYLNSQDCKAFKAKALLHSIIVAQ